MSKHFHSHRIAIFVTVGLALSLVGCATPYRPPSQPAPPAWSGKVGVIEHQETLNWFDGVMSKGDPILEIEFSHRRTGVVANTVETTTPFGGKLILPAGSLAFATNFTLFASYGYGPRKNQQLENNPIEWCVILAGGSSGQEDKPELYCLFWENETSARYINSIGDYVYSPFMLGDTSGMAGPVPEIVEQKVDFGVALKKQLQIYSIKSKGVKLVLRETDGTNNKYVYRAAAKYHKWNEAGQVTVRNKFGTFTIHRIDDKSVRVVLPGE